MNKLNLQPHFVDLVSQKEFLRNTVGMEWKTGGGTLDAGEFDSVKNDDGFVPAGTAVVLNDDGFYVPFEDATEGGDGETPTANSEGAGLTANDVNVNNGNVIVGILIAGHPIEDKCTGVTKQFKDAVKGYLRFDA